MSYLSVSEIQSWLQATKHVISAVDTNLEEAAFEKIVGKVGRRYDTSTWVDTATTPTMIINLMAMQVAADEYRKWVSENRGEPDYSDSLDERIMRLCEGIADGSIILFDGSDEISPSPDTSLGGTPAGFPTDAATEAYDTLPFDDGSAPRVFQMNMRF